jgi:UDP-N-acetylglucosamine--dolichyl-phosphate N-acetylglucosaminephosphotransferase
MSLLSTFSTNSINILAGINGSEVLQAIIITISVIVNDLLYLPWPIDWRIPLHLLGNQSEIGSEIRIGGVWSAGMAHGSRVLVERHLFSLYFMLPLLGVCTGFLYHNWYGPRESSRVLQFCVDMVLRAGTPRELFQEILSVT